MKKIVIYTLVFLSLFNCNKKKNMKELNSQNFVEKMLENVKRYNYEPEYLLRIGNNTAYEVYVNDIPLQKHYSETQIATPLDINFLILKSGEQEVKFRLYAYENEDFDEESGIHIRVLVRDNIDVERLGIGNAKETLIIEREFRVNQLINKGGYYEGEFTFTAEVPYENKGWSDGQDLTQFDKKELETAVVNFYKKMWNIYNDKKNPDQLFPYIEQKDKELVQSLFQDEYEIKENLKAHLRPFVNPTYQLQPLENYKMTLYGDGKIVALEQTSMDIRLRGRLALWAKFSFEGEKSIKTSFPHLYLYLPKGKNLQDGLQIIR